MPTQKKFRPYWLLVLWSKAIATASLLTEYKVHSLPALHCPHQMKKMARFLHAFSVVIYYSTALRLEVWKHLANDHAKL